MGSFAYPVGVFQRGELCRHPMLWVAPFSAMFSCGQKACSGVFADQLSLELVKGCGYVKE